MDDWWGNYLGQYSAGNSNLFHCPVLQGVRNQYTPGFQWSWTGIANPGDRIGYGANVFFLFYPASSVQVGGTFNFGGFNFTTGYGFKRSSILKPTDTMMIGDSEGWWSMSLFWPNTVMDESNPGYEGIACRHGGGSGKGKNGGQGVVVFTDGHSESRRDENINQQPGQPLKNSKYWDPLRGAGDQ